MCFLYTVNKHHSTHCFWTFGTLEVVGAEHGWSEWGSGSVQVFLGFITVRESSWSENSSLITRTAHVHSLVSLVRLVWNRGLCFLLVSDSHGLSLSFPGSASAFCCEVSKTECSVLREERTVNLWCGCFTPPVPWVFWFSQLVRFSLELLSWSSDSELHVGESFSLKCALLHILAVNFLCHEVVWAADSILDTIEEIHVLCLGWISSFVNFQLLILVHPVSVSSYEWLLSNPREFWWIKRRSLIILINKHPPVISFCPEVF